MEVTKKEVIDLVQVLEDGQVQVRKATRYYDGNKLISQEYHRHVVEPGDSLTKEDAWTAAVCGAIHTKDVIDKYKDKQPKGDKL